MSNPSKVKGTRAEGEVVRWLAGVTGWPVYRRVLAGVLDVGDIGGVPNTCLEVKAGNGAGRLHTWLTELDREQANLGADHGFVVWRTPGSTDPHLWIVLARPHSRFLRPRYPIPGPTARLPYYVRRLGHGWSAGGASYVGALCGFRCDGFMPESPDDCHGVAMTGAAFETWLTYNLNPDAYDTRPERREDARA